MSSMVLGLVGGCSQGLFPGSVVFWRLIGVYRRVWHVMLKDENLKLYESYKCFRTKYLSPLQQHNSYEIQLGVVALAVAFVPELWSTLIGLMEAAYAGEDRPKPQ